MWQVYVAAKPDYSGRVTVPVLWDRKRETIVSNESSEIIRMFNSAFDGLTGDDTDFCPDELRDEIEAVNDFVYPNVNNGVYRAGFATTQEAYEEAVADVFDALDRLEDRLSGQRYVTGGTITEADWRLFTTLVRFDPVYVGHFKCNIRRIADYPNLSNYTRDLFQVPGVAETVDLDHIKRHYYASHDTINPTRIVPAGPAEEAPAEARDQVEHRVEQRHRLPERRQHRDRVEAAAEEDQRRDHQQRHELQLLEIARPDADDEAEQR
jgi:putative glutathione S-transferase